MQLVAPDILEQAKGLSILACVGGLFLGWLLWLLGWYGNRFWIAFSATLGAGVYGLTHGAVYGVQPLISGLVLALLAGLMARLLIHLLAYFAGGLAGLLVVHLLVPRWDEPVICILAGGLLGVMFFRFWVMLITSGLGTLLMTYSFLGLLDVLGKMDMVAFAGKRAAVLNYVCAGGTLLGLIVQFLIERRFGGGASKGSGKPSQPPKKNLLQWGLEQLKKAA